MAPPGAITVEDVPLVPVEVDEHFQAVLEWSDELRRLGVRANADQPADAETARRFGAEGVGLCRTEHMFLGDDRQAKMQAMIMAEDEAARRASPRRAPSPFSRTTSKASSRRWRGCR